jgi:hypothetical protein
MPRKEYFDIHRWDGTLIARHVTRSVDANKIARDSSKMHGQSYVYLRDDSGKLIGIYHYVQVGNDIKVSFDGGKNPEFRHMTREMSYHYQRHLRMSKKLGVKPLTPIEFKKRFVGGGRKKHGLSNPHFLVYIGDTHVNAGTSLDKAFSVAKAHSKRSGESYLYDVDKQKFIAHFVNGILTQETKQRAVASSVKYQHKGPQVGVKNPKRGTLVYSQVNRIIATKTQEHVCDAECKRHGHRYFHDFTSRPKMYGLPNGDLLITTR